MASLPLALGAFVLLTSPAQAGSASGDLITLTRELAMRDGLCVSIEMELSHAVACTVPLDEGSASIAADALRACGKPTVNLEQTARGSCAELKEPGARATHLLDSKVIVSAGRRTLSEVADQLDEQLRASRDPSAPPTLHRVRAEGGVRSRSALLVDVPAGERSVRDLLRSITVVDTEGALSDAHIVWVAYSSIDSETLLLIPTGRRVPAEIALDEPSSLDVLIEGREELQRQIDDPSTSEADRALWQQTLIAADRKIEAERQRLGMPQP